MSPLTAKVKILLDAYRKVAGLNRQASRLTPSQRMIVRVAARHLQANLAQAMDQTMRLILLDGLEPKRPNHFSKGRSILRSLARAKKALEEKFPGAEPEWVERWTGRGRSGLFKKVLGHAKRLTRTTVEQGFGPEELIQEFLALRPSKGQLHPWVRAAAGKHEKAPGIGPEVDPIRYAGLAKAVMGYIQGAKFKKMVKRVEEVDPDTGKTVQKWKWREELGKGREGDEDPSETYLPGDTPETEWTTPMTQDTWDMSEFITQAIIGDLHTAEGVSAAPVSPSDRVFKQGPGAKVWDFLQFEMKKNLQRGKGWEARSAFLSEFLKQMKAGNEYAMIEAIVAGERRQKKKKGKREVFYQRNFKWENASPAQQSKLLDKYHKIVGRAAAAAREEFVQALEDPKDRRDDELQAAVDDLRAQAEVLRGFKRLRGDDILDPEVIAEREGYLNFLTAMEKALKSGRYDFDEAASRAAKEADPDNPRALDRYISKLRGDRRSMKDFLFLSQFNKLKGEGLEDRQAERAAIGKVEGIILLDDEMKARYAKFMEVFKRRRRKGDSFRKAMHNAIKIAEGVRTYMSDVREKYQKFMETYKAKAEKNREREPDKRRKPEQLLRESAAKAEGVKALSKDLREHYKEFRTSPAAERRQKMMTRYQERATSKQMADFVPMFEAKLNEGLPWNDALTAAVGEIIRGWDSKDEYQKRNLRTKYVKGLEADPARERRLSLLANYHEARRKGLDERDAFRSALERTVGRKNARVERIAEEYGQYLRKALAGA